MARPPRDLEELPYVEPVRPREGRVEPPPWEFRKDRRPRKRTPMHHADKRRRRIWQ